MTDPIYGDNPVDPDYRWWQTMRPPLVNDPEIEVWRNVIGGAVGDLLESSWSVRWRTGSVMTALGVHLDALGDDLGFPRPDGWDADRYRAALIPIEGAAGTRRTPAATKALAGGLADGSQTWLISQADPLTYVVYFFGVSDDEAMTYYSVLDRGRPTAVRMVLVYSPSAAEDVFTLDSSLLDGPDVLAKMI